MYAVQQLVQDGRLIKRVDNFRDNLTLGLHATHGRHIQKTRHYSVYGCVPQTIADGDLKPAPFSRLAPQAAAPFSSSIGNVSDSPKLIPKLVRLLGVYKFFEIPAKEFFRTHSESAR